MTLDKFGRHISKRYKINEIDINNLVNEAINNILLKDLDYKKNRLHTELNINKISSDMKSLEEFVKNENKLLKDNIEKINQIMTTKIKEVVFFNAKESIKRFRTDIEKLKITKIEILDSFLNGRQNDELTLPDRQIVLDIHQTIDSINKKLLEEVNKINVGMGELDTILNPTSLKLLNTKIKDTLDDMHKNIDKVEEYLKEENTTILTQKLKEWNDTYKSSWDSYFIRSI